MCKFVINTKRVVAKTVRVAFCGVQLVLASMGNLTAMRRSRVISKRNRPDIIPPEKLTNNTALKHKYHVTRNVAEHH
jgi:hypothetical protein